MQSKNFLSLFPVRKPVLGMLHLKGDSREEMLQRALLETDLMLSSGVDAVIVENYFGSVEDVECVLSCFHRDNAGFIYGVNVLNHDALAFEFAKKYGASFIQLDSVAGHLTPEEDVGFGRFMEENRAEYKGCVLGGVRFKYQPYNSGRSLEEDLKIGTTRCDAIVVTGNATGENTPMEKIQAFRGIIGKFPLVVGAGVVPETVAEHFAVCDAAIVGSYFKEGYVDTGNVASVHVQTFMNAVGSCR